MVSLTRSVGVRRSRASCSSLAIASILYCVGFVATLGGDCFFMGKLLKTFRAESSPSRKFGHQYFPTKIAECLRPVGGKRLQGTLAQRLRRPLTAATASSLN